MCYKGNISTHGGSFIAVSKSIPSTEIEHNLPQCCVAAEITVNNKIMVVCAFYNPPADSVYRYIVSAFKLMLTFQHGSKITKYSFVVT